MKLPILACALLLVSACTLPQDDQACTLIGCDNGAHASFSRPQAAFTARVASFPDTLSFSCEGGRAIMDTTLPAGYLHAYHCTDTGFVVAGWELKNTRKKADFTIMDGSGTVLFQGAKDLAWGGDFYPNGKECDRYPCRSARVSLDLAP